MSEATRALEPPSRRFDRVSLLVLVAWLLYFAWAVFLVVHDHWHAEWDGAIYLLTAQSLAAGEGYQYLGEAFFLRPPGLPWLLSWTFPGPVYDWAVLHRLLHTAAALAIGLWYLCLRRRFSRPIALGTALVTGITPLFLQSFNAVLSELPFLAALFASIAMLHRSARRDRGWLAWSLGGSLALGAAFYLRSVAILMAPALLVVGWRRDRGGQHLRGLVPALVFGVLVAPWLVHSRAATEQEPSQQLLLRDYATAMFHTDPGDPASPVVAADEWMRRLQENGRDLLLDVGRTVIPIEGVVLAVLVGIATALGFVISLRRGPDLLDWFFVAYLALILTYFTYDTRLALPLAPLTLMYLVELLRWMGGRVGRGRGDVRAPGMGLIVLGVLALIVLPESLDAESRPGEEGGTMSDTWEDVEKIGSWLRANTAPDAKILCNKAPLLSVASQRRCYSYRFLRDADFLERYGIDWVVFDAYAPPRLRGFIRQRAENRTILESAIEPNKIVIFEMK